jgi:hypothetical protein
VLASPDSCSEVDVKVAELLEDDSEIDEEALSESNVGMSEWARVKMEVLMSSSRGVRKETCFGAEKSGFEMDILLNRAVGSGVFVKMDRRLCEGLYGKMVGSEKVEAEDTDDVLGVLELCGSVGVFSPSSLLVKVLSDSGGLDRLDF